MAFTKISLCLAASVWFISDVLTLECQQCVTNTNWGECDVRGQIVTCTEEQANQFHESVAKQNPILGDIPSDRSVFQCSQLVVQQVGVPRGTQYVRACSYYGVDYCSGWTDTVTLVQCGLQGDDPETTSTVPGSSSTVEPGSSSTAEPDPSSTAESSSSSTAVPGSTAVPDPSSTSEPVSSSTAAPDPSSTVEPGPSSTAAPGSSSTAVPGSTSTAAPGSTTTAAPGSSSTAAPGSSSTSAPGSSTTASPGSSSTVAPGSTSTAAPVTSPTAAPGSSTTAAPSSTQAPGGSSGIPLMAVWTILAIAALAHFWK